MDPHHFHGMWPCPFLHFFLSVFMLILLVLPPLIFLVLALPLLILLVLFDALVFLLFVLVLFILLVLLARSCGDFGSLDLTATMI